MAHALAIAKKIPLGYENLIEAMEANEEFGKRSCPFTPSSDLSCE